MSELLLPFARRTADGQFVSPEEVPRGLGCGCVCPGCGHPVQARHGTERVWHFAHAKASGCTEAYEKSVHEAAKQMLRERKQLLLPALSATVQEVDAFYRLLQAKEDIFPRKQVMLDTCKSGQVIDGVSPDLVGMLRGHQVLIEITVFHRLMPEKLERLVNTGLTILEIHLSEFKTRQATRQSLENALFEREDNRYWVWHPARAAAEERLRTVLRQQLAVAQAEHAQQEKEKEVARATADRARLEALRSPPLGQERSPRLEDVVWRAGFPAEERWSPARAAFCERHLLPRGQVDAVFGSITRRSELAHTTPKALAQSWAKALDVTADDVFRYFTEGGYVL